MKKLSKAQSRRLDKVRDAVTSAHAGLTTAVDQFNEAQAEAFGEVENALDAYNGAVAAADEFREEIRSAIADYSGELSDRWQESDAGQSYQQWENDWDEALEPVKIDKPENLDTPEDEVSAALENLATEPG